MTPAPRGSALHRAAWLFVWVALAAQLAAVWSVRDLPSQDGPLHTYNAAMPFTWPNATTAAAASSPRLMEHLEPRSTLASWFAQRVIGVLTRLVGDESSEQLFVSLYFALFAAGCWYVIVGVRPENGVLMGLLPVLAVNYPMQMGFYAFSLSLLPALLAIGLWVRPTRRRAVSIVLQAIALVVAFLCHPFGLVVAGVAGVALSIGRARPAGSSRWAALARDLMAQAIAALPASALLLGSMESDDRGLSYLLPGPNRLIARLTHEPEWVGFSRVEWVPVLIVLVPVVAIALWAARERWSRRSLDVADGLALASVALFGLYLALPDTLATGGYVRSRLSLWSAIAVALWAGAVTHAPRRRDLLAMLGALATIAQAGVQYHSYRQFDGLLAEYRSVLQLVPPHATLLPLSTADRGTEPDVPVWTTRPRPFLHAAGRIGTTTDVVLLENYQAQRQHFPVRFRDTALTLDAAYIYYFPYAPLAWPIGPRGRVGDYVLIWGPIDPARFPDSHLPDVLATLEREYVLVHTSSPRGLAHLWRRR